MDNSRDESSSQLSEKDISQNHNESKSNVSIFNKINQFTAARNDSTVSTSLLVSFLIIQYTKWAIEAIKFVKILKCTFIFDHVLVFNLIFNLYWLFWIFCYSGCYFCDWLAYCYVLIIFHATSMHNNGIVKTILLKDPWRNW